MLKILSGPLANAGLDILGGIIGGKAGPIVTTVGDAVLKELGVTTPEQAARKIESDPEAVARHARLEADRGPEWAAVALAEQRTAQMLADRESQHHGFAYWWRPGGMYLNLYLWLQNTRLTPVLFNGVLKMQVPMIPWEHLLGFARASPCLSGSCIRGRRKRVDRSGLLNTFQGVRDQKLAEACKEAKEIEAPDLVL
jgi:hypothetical protein